MGKRVLVIDLDHQCNTTMLLDVEDQALESGKNIGLAFEKDLKISEVLIKSSIKNIDVIAGCKDLENHKEKWNGHPKRFKLLDVLLNDKALSKYDLVLIDTHPSYDCYLQSALVSSHYYIIPLFAEEFSIRGLGQMINSVESIRKYHNETLSFLGCIITKFDKKSKTHVSFEEEIRKVSQQNEFNVFDNTIPYSKAVASAEASHLPLTIYRPGLPVSLSYNMLAGEILPKLKGKKTGRPRVHKLSKVENFEECVDL